MTGTDIFEIWVICGAISAIWHVVDEWWHHEVLGHTLVVAVLLDILLAGFCLLAGPIGLAVKIWEKFFDPTNI